MQVEVSSETRPANDLRERRPRNELHHDEVNAAEFPRSVDAGYIWMIQSRRFLSFPLS